MIARLAHSAREHRWRWLLSYGVIVASVGYVWLGSVRLEPLSCSRALQLQTAIRVLDAGGPPLTSYDTSVSPPVYEPAGVGDDQGPVLYMAELGHLGHTLDPNQTYRWAFRWLFSLTLLLYPLLFGAIFDSPLAGVLAPLALGPLVIAPLDGAANPYWIAAWVVATCLPLVMYASRKQGRALLGFLVVAALVAGAGESIRTGAGLPIALAALLAVLRASTSWRWRALCSSGVILAYLATSMGVLTAARDYRNAKIGTQPLSATFRAQYGGRTISSPLPTSHPLWHQIYIGLGFAPNRYGIQYHDASAEDYVQSVAPGTPLLGSRYSAILRKRVIHIVESDPEMVIRVTAEKAGLLMADAVNETPLVLLVLPLLIVAPFRRRAGPLLILCLPALVVSFLAPLITVPLPDYERGWLAIVGLVVLIGVLTVVVDLRGAWARSPFAPLGRLIAHRISRLTAPYLGERQLALRTGELRLRPLTRTALRQSLADATRRHPRTTFVLVILFLCFAGFALEASRLTAGAEADRAYLPAFGPVTPHLDRARLRTWDFSKGVPASWLTVRGSARTSAGGTAYVTGGGQFDEQLVSPLEMLEPGNYEVIVDGAIPHGAMSVFVEPPDAKGPLPQPPGTIPPQANTIFNQNTQFAASQRIGLIFRVLRPEMVRIYLANSTPPGVRSHWILRSVSLASTPDAPESCTGLISSSPRSAPGVTPVIAPLVLRRWQMAIRPSGRLIAARGVKTRVSGPRSLAVITNRYLYGYQLATSPLTLAAGRYHVDLRGRAVAGGLRLLAVELGAGGTQWLLGQAPLAEALPGVTPSTHLEFELPRLTTLELVMENAPDLANAARTGFVSHWRLDSLQLEREPLAIPGNP